MLQNYEKIRNERRRLPILTVSLVADYYEKSLKTFAAWAKMLNFVFRHTLK
jgi:hypothetical protein